MSSVGVVPSPSSEKPVSILSNQTIRVIPLGWLVVGLAPLQHLQGSTSAPKCKQHHPSRKHTGTILELILTFFVLAPPVPRSVQFFAMFNLCFSSLFLCFAQLLFLTLSILASFHYFKGLSVLSFYFDRFALLPVNSLHIASSIVF